MCFPLEQDVRNLPLEDIYGEKLFYKLSEENSKRRYICPYVTDSLWACHIIYSLFNIPHDFHRTSKA